MSNTKTMIRLCLAQSKFFCRFGNERAKSNMFLCDTQFRVANNLTCHIQWTLYLCT